MKQNYSSFFSFQVSVWKVFWICDVFLDGGFGSSLCFFRPRLGFGGFINYFISQLEIFWIFSMPSAFCSVISWSIKVNYFPDFGSRIYFLCLFRGFSFLLTGFCWILIGAYFISGYMGSSILVRDGYLTSVYMFLLYAND